MNSEGAAPRRRWWIPAVAFVVLALAVSGLVWALAESAIGETHRGYFAPVWNSDGTAIYAFERETSGRVWGFGWEFFTPPAHVRVTSDRLSLLKIDPETGESAVLETFEPSPLVDLDTRRYRGRIFGVLGARLVPLEGGVEFAARISVPRVPSAQTWGLVGVWTESQPSNAEWQEGTAVQTGRPDEVLRDNVELMVVPGPEAFPCAVVAVNADGTYRVVTKTQAYQRLYPTGVPPVILSERSARTRIEEARHRAAVEEELLTEYRAQGMTDGEAQLRAHDAMVEMGLYPKPPQMVAEPIQATPEGLREFHIPADYFDVGLFQDIARAIDNPGEETKAGSGTYLKYYDDNLGPELREWIEDGHDRFTVLTNDRLYLIEIVRYDNR